MKKWILCYKNLTVHSKGTVNPTLYPDRAKLLSAAPLVQISTLAPGQLDLHVIEQNSFFFFFFLLKLSKRKLSSRKKWVKHRIETD